MSELPTNDRALINFLKQHRPPVPEATPDLEEKILAALDSQEDSLQPSMSTPTPVSTGTLRSLRSIFSWIAAGLTLVSMGYRLVNTSSLTPSEQAQLEGFIESNWYGAMEETQETNWLTISDGSPD
ncbi:hypothetical protein ACL6C3_10540 [Capilliphycus salinus ALCB114379]|uniref:hypothetical protein n=1 Tax=Capilliphycus salinus TaxID=2768948 RepID=UPI0039A42E3D